MSITVLSPSTLPQLPADPSATSGESVTGGFADLLALQLSDLLGPALAAASEPETAVGKDEGANQAPDTALLFAGLMANPPAENPADTAVPDEAALIGDGKGRREPAASALPSTAIARHPDDLPESADKATPLTAQDARALPITPGTGKAANIAANVTSEQAGPDFATTLAASASAVAPQRPATHLSVPVPVTDSRWAQDFSNQIVWLARSDQQSAQISLNPPQLGPVHITLNLKGDQASAVFASPHAEIRQIIEDALPRLREMLAGAGIDLGQANVGAQLGQQQRGTTPQGQETPRFAADQSILRVDSGLSGGLTAPKASVGRGLVDLFA